MKNIFGISIGCVNKLVKDKNRNAYIDLIRKSNLPINALEIIIPPDEIEYFNLTYKNLHYINNMKYLSVHLLDSIGHNKNLILQLRRNGITPKINIIHSDIFISNINDEIVEYLIENTDIDTDIIKNTYYCFDICHSLMSVGYNKTIELFLDNKKYISQIHLSDYFNSIDHTVFDYSGMRIINMNDKLKLKKYPIIIEINFNSEKQMLSEINFLRKVIYK